ncbi:lactonase family protein [Compostimonas suwonensis]|nr:beta-propeller fold lactonase family protein [Compostimonas suwonensis]
MHIGSYSLPSPWAAAPDGHGAGIVLAELDRADGSLTLLDARHDDDPAYILSDRNAGILWTTSEVEHGGELVGYRVASDGVLGEASRVETGVDAPCHVHVDLSHGIAITAHYQGRRFCVISLADGMPEHVLQVIDPPQWPAGVDRRAARPRPHSSLSVGDLVVAADCGRDALLLYAIDRAAETPLRLVDSLALPEGTGPRHLAFDGERKLIFVSNQNRAGISVVFIDEAARRLELRQIIASPGLGRGDSLPSEIALHPELDLVYIANRRDESISSFEIVSDAGELAPRASVDVHGAWPRHFRITPEADFLLVANQNSDQVVSFSIDGDGGLEWTGRSLDVATPTMIRYW